MTSTRNQLKLTDTGQNNIRNEKSIVDKSKSSFKMVFLSKNQQNNGKKSNSDNVQCNQIGSSINESTSMRDNMLVEQLEENMTTQESDTDNNQEDMDGK